MSFSDIGNLCSIISVAAIAIEWIMKKFSKMRKDKPSAATDGLSSYEVIFIIVM